MHVNYNGLENILIVLIAMAFWGFVFGQIHSWYVRKTKIPKLKENLKAKEEQLDNIKSSLLVILRTFDYSLLTEHLDLEKFNDNSLSFRSKVIRNSWHLLKHHNFENEHEVQKQYEEAQRLLSDYRQKKEIFKSAIKEMEETQKEHEPLR